jgi:hypothetical protein
MKTLYKRILLIVVVCLAQFEFGICQLHQQDTNSFSIIALGDMPYFLPQDYSRFQNAINFINTQNNAFTVFVGDIKSSKTNCSDDVYHKMYNYFEQFKKPLIYTPGDNEWTDCKETGNNSSHKEERLDFLRKTFFKDSGSLGQQKMELISQSSFTGHEKFVENKRWNYKNVSFATIHIVGSNNNYSDDSTDLNREFFERNRANIFWLNELFGNAKKDSSLGIALFIHADMFLPDKGESGFVEFVKELKLLTIQYSKPVLLVNGDSHRFIVDKPLYNDKANEKTLLNFTRMQVFGEYDMHAVEIVINKSNPGLFEIKEVLIPGN